MNKLIIFDFDGTLCNSRNISIGLVRELAKQENNQKLLQFSEKEWQEKDVKYLLKKSGLGPIELFVLAEKLRKKLLKKIDQLKLFNGIKSGLVSLDHEVITLGVLSSNHQKVLESCLSELPFEFIQSNRNLFGKAASLKKLAKKYQATQKIYVGDEKRDMDAAIKANFMPIGVSWGGDTKKTLKEASAAKVFDTPEQLFRFLDDN